MTEHNKVQEAVGRLTMDGLRLMPLREGTAVESDNKLVLESINKVKRMEDALLKVNNILFDLEINADKEISGKNIAPVRQVIKQALKEQES